MLDILLIVFGLVGVLLIILGAIAMQKTYKLIKSQSLPSGVMIANFKREGEVKIGSF